MKNLRLKAARAARDLSQQQLADLVGVSRQTINAIEMGDYNPTINLCVAVCRALGKMLDELFWTDAPRVTLQAHKIRAAFRPPVAFAIGFTCP